MPSNSSDANGDPREHIVAAIRDQTHLILGRTIGYSKEEWASSTPLPGWTRSHVAAHLVANAKRLIRRIAESSTEPAGADEYEEPQDLEVAALADGLTLQIDLDVTAGKLDDAMATMQDPYQIAIIRLREVVLHGYDLDPSTHELDLSAAVAGELFDFIVSTVSDEDLPDLLLRTDDGREGRIGSGEPTATVTGPAQDLLLWLTRGVMSERLEGAPQLGKII